MLDSMFASCCVGPGLWADSNAKGLMEEGNPWGSYQRSSGSSQQVGGAWQPTRPWEPHWAQEPPDAWQQPGAWQWQQLEKGWSGAAWDDTQVWPVPTASFQKEPLLLAPDRTSGMTGGWGEEEQMGLKQSLWVQELQAALTKLSIATAPPVTMATFNQSLKAVVESHSADAIKYMDPVRFRHGDTKPCTSWKAGCFSPTTPSIPKEEVNEIGKECVDWAYHLAAVLRLMSTGKERKRYLVAKHLMPADTTSTYTVFFNGMAGGMAACFKHLLGTLTPPVILAATPALQTGAGGLKGRPKTASYHMKVTRNGAAEREAQDSIVQLVMAFHQRLAQWPGQHSHTKCYPWVIGNFCKTGMHHPPLILIELAFGAWEQRAEDLLPKIDADILACNMGAMARPGLGMTSDSPEAVRKMREEVREPLLESLRLSGQSADWIEVIDTWIGEAAEAPPAALFETRPRQQTVPPKPPDAAAAADGGDMATQDATALHIAMRASAAQEARIASQADDIDVLGSFREQVLRAERALEEKDKKAREEKASTAEESASTHSCEASALELLSSLKEVAGPRMSTEELSIFVDVLRRKHRATPGAASSASQAAVE